MRPPLFGDTLIEKRVEDVMSEQAASENVMRSLLGTLEEHGLTQAEIINSLDTSLEDKYRRMQDLAREMNGECPYKDVPLFVVGQRAFRSPVVPSEIDDTDEEERPADRYKYALGPDGVFGYAHGFNVRPVDDPSGDEDAEQHLVLCHAVRTGESATGEDAEGNLVVVHEMAYFAIGASEVDFLDDLRAAFDGIMEHPNLDNGRKFRALQRSLELLGFGCESPRRQNTIISYLNAYDIFSPYELQQFKASYAVLCDLPRAGETMELGDDFTGGIFSEFVAVDYHDQHTDEHGQIVDVVTPGVGVLTSLYPRDAEPLMCIVPLNQLVRMRPENSDLAGAAIQAA